MEPNNDGRTTDGKEFPRFLPSLFHTSRPSRDGRVTIDNRPGDWFANRTFRCNSGVTNVTPETRTSPVSGGRASMEPPVGPSGVTNVTPGVACPLTDTDGHPHLRTSKASLTTYLPLQPPNF